MEAAIQEEGGGDENRGDEALKLPAEESISNEEAGCTRLHKSSCAASAPAEMELDVGSEFTAEEGSAEDAAPPNLGALGSCVEDEQLRLLAAAAPPPVSYAGNHISDGPAINVAHSEDKKLQYTLRSNPKRSRRFLDPDYTLELAAPASASSPCAAPPASTSSALASSSAPAPIKKGNSLFSEKARACTECGKQFPSWKALFGHMRCHPERQWRGIQPPTSISNLRERMPDRTAAVGPPQHGTMIKDADGDYKPAAPTKSLAISPPAPSFRDQSDADDAIKPRVSGPRPRCDAEESDTESIEAAYMNGREHHHAPAVDLNGLGGRGERRSKRSLQDLVSGGDGGHFSESHTPPDEVMEDCDMADCLVMLAFAAKSKADESDGDSALLNWKNHVRQSPLLSLTEARKAMELKEKRSSYNGRVQKSIHFLQEGEGTCDRNWEDDHDKGSWDHKSRFECSTCKKTFRSHQALGGHRASHKKVKGCFARTNAAEEGGSAPADAAAEMSSIALTMATGVENAHQQSCQREEEDVVDTIVQQQIAGDQEEQGPYPAPTPPPEEMSMGQFLQFSITCSEKMEEDQTFESAIASPEKQMQLKHQASSCSSSSSIIAATAGTFMLHHHHHNPLQQSQQSKIHQCSICNRVFSTGQALGGHKRCHWGGSSMPEPGKRCSLLRQDSDGAACATGIAMSDQRTSELSRKGRQDSGSFASVEAWMNISLSSAAMEKDLAHVSGISNKGRQDSVPSCDEMKAGHASAHSWLGGHVLCEEEELDLNKVMMGPGRRTPSQAEQADEGMSAQRGWVEAASSNPKLSGKNQLQVVVEGGYNRHRGAIACDLELVKGDRAGEERGGGCECSRSLVETGEEGNNNINKQVPVVQLKMEELLDLNLPAPAEEEERGAAGDSLPLTAASNWLSSKERVAESAGN
ncbi:hypothetical protein GOP47_0008879 [Adiantum capillus-veneris]|uniref:C2H2-type domain-containing protein n=1 Tax=Adiantum capillus-veneris TaxID=13818 RepID=A0A9D4UZG4_ADICA|nr:hypothetical protein GOP47_0008879 [Adiantum capillus-veneris]